MMNLEELMQDKKQEQKTAVATATATPDGLAEPKLADPFMSMGNNELVVMEQQKEETKELQLTPEERQKVDAISKSIDLRDSKAILAFGAPAQQRIAQFSDNVLAQVRTKDSGDVGKLLTTLVTNVQEFNPENKSVLADIPIIGRFVKKAKDVKTEYTSLSANVQTIQGNLEKSKLKMMQDVELFDRLYQENVEYFKVLQLYIVAGEEKVKEMREVTLPELHRQAAESNDPMASQVVTDFEANVNRFEKKVHDLKISKTICIQTAPQIRLIQNNDKVLIDRIQTAIYNTIPLWKSQLVIALGLESQKAVLGMQKAVSDTTNELLRRNAELLQTNSIEVAKENERSIVDVETVREVNERLINTIQETISIQQQGRQKRQQAEQELAQIEGKLKETLLSASNRHM